VPSSLPAADPQPITQTGDSWASPVFVDVSSSNFDRYDRKPNTGEPFGSVAAMAVAEQFPPRPRCRVARRAARGAASLTPITGSARSRAGRRWAAARRSRLATTRRRWPVLEAGGNAIDAGCCAGMVLAVLHADEVNFAGVAPIMIRTREGRVMTIAGLGHWPRALPPDLFMREHGGTIPPDAVKIGENLESAYRLAGPAL
jgi:hypothetical protein